MNFFTRLLLGNQISLLADIFDGTITTFFKDRVTPKIGSIVYCDLVTLVEHTGVYVGEGKIAHLDGDGFIELVSPNQFLRRLGGNNPAITIYVSCQDTNAVGELLFAIRARALEGRKTNYNVLLNNCHKFTAGCITGEFNHNALTFSFLEFVVWSWIRRNKMWRAWEMDNSGGLVIPTENKSELELMHKAVEILKVSL